MCYFTESITFQAACGVSSVLIILAELIVSKAATSFEIIIVIHVDIKAMQILMGNARMAHKWYKLCRLTALVFLVEI